MSDPPDPLQCNHAGRPTVTPYRMRTTALVLLLAVAAAAERPALTWNAKLGPALEEAKRTKRPVLVYVYDST